MASSTTTFRLSVRDRASLDRLADELVCSRTDVLRYGIAALREASADVRSQIRADNLARAFIKNLITQYGEDAVIELQDGPADREWRLAGAPLDPSVAEGVVRRQGDRWVMDLVSPATNVGIRNVESWEGDRGHRHIVVPLRALWVYSQTRTGTEPETRQLVDGRAVVRFREDDGTVRQLVIDDEGHAHPLKSHDVPIARLTDLPPSIGIGLRRESELGPHLGTGYGVSVKLGDDLENNRERVVAELRRLLAHVEEGKIDNILLP